MTSSCNPSTMVIYQNLFNFSKLYKIMNITTVHNSINCSNCEFT